VINNLMSVQFPSHLSDDELITVVKRHAQGTRESTVALIVHLTELSSRGLHLAAGFGSLYKYCREELRLAEHAAYHVMKAIRPARRYPLILDKLLDGSLEREHRPHHRATADASELRGAARGGLG
jgi:hypothetical protein